MSGLISVDEALAAIIANPLPRVTVSAPLAECLGARLAETLLARTTLPPAAASAMDGYAVRLADVRTPGARLRVIGEAPAGRPFAGTVQSGEAVRIFTGAELPPGADTIVIQEDVDRDDAVIVCRTAYETNCHVRPAGLDFRAGDALIAQGSLLGAPELAIAAAANHGALPIWRRARVAILANGDELHAPGQDLPHGAIVSSNPYALGALISQWGAQPQDLGIAADSPDAIMARLRAARAADVIVPIGGASVGDHDYMRAAFAASGFETIFEKIAVRPGKPTWFARRGDQLALGLPGNPASALVCAHLFLRTLLTGQAPAYVPARLAEPLPANGPREAFLRARAHLGEVGALIASAAPNQDSALLTPFLWANCLIRRPAGAAPLAPGARVDIVLIGAL